MKWNGLLLLILSFTDAFAQHLQVAMSQYQTKTGIVLNLKPLPQPGYRINTDGPWKLTLTSSQGYRFDPSEYHRSHMNKDHSFTLAPAQPLAKDGVIGYRLVGFTCTDDKKICHRDLITGEIKIKNGQVVQP